jgi:hypothetical protein
MPDSKGFAGEACFIVSHICFNNLLTKYHLRVNLYNVG